MRVWDDFNYIFVEKLACWASCNCSTMIELIVKGPIKLNRIIEGSNYYYNFFLFLYIFLSLSLSLSLNAELIFHKKWPKSPSQLRNVERERERAHQSICFDLDVSQTRKRELQVRESLSRRERTENKMGINWFGNE